MAENLVKTTAKNTKKTIFYPIVEILGIKVSFINLKNALPLVENWVNSNKQHQISTPNPEHIILAQKDKEFRGIINRSDLAIPDGVGVVWAAKLLGLSNSLRSTGSKSFSSNGALDNNQSNHKVIGETLLTKKNIIEQSPRKLDTKNFSTSLREFNRLTGTDLMISLCQLAAQKHWRVFLLGGKDGAAEKAAKKLRGYSSSEVEKFKNNSSRFSAIRHNRRRRISRTIDIAYYQGSKDIQRETLEERQQTITQINNFKPHLLFVAYGAPYQEKWIYHNLASLKSVKVAMGVGGAFDYLAGTLPRAPQTIRKMGLEWLWRLFYEPWRLRRQLALGKFVCLVLREKIIKCLND